MLYKHNLKTFLNFKNQNKKQGSKNLPALMVYELRCYFHFRFIKVERES